MSQPRTLSSGAPAPASIGPKSQDLVIRPEGLKPGTKLPVVYHPEYNISFYGLEKIHPFDAGKWGKIFDILKNSGLLNATNFHVPHEATKQELLLVHSQSYLNKLKWSAYVATVTEVPFVAFLPNCMVQRRVLRPFRYQTAGTILAAGLALDHGWAVHLGGGFHHASANQGGGFCCYADITLAVQTLRGQGRIRRAMVVDLDAHQGNGYARDFMGDQDVYIMDVYNKGIYPHDEYAKTAIRRKVEIRSGTSDEPYLKLVDENLMLALNEFSPDLVVFNAGTDILDGDVLGRLSISDQGVVRRDALVFRQVRTRDIPLVMVTSGGYQRRSARVIAESILHLCKKRLLYLEEPHSRASASEVAHQ
ncbi:histone deacetylase 11 [Ixodes scapularis]|uniref:histone deacetylase 11 n=1 Tax=Ixodes scapularis TaxID=6945 RepID=UPI001C381193|nr:histone deacetylase 11 [Ixodes scapularis]